MVFSCFLSIYAFYTAPPLFEKLIFHPFTLPKKKNFYTLFTSIFLHGDFVHLGVNIAGLLLFASNAEILLGTGKFVGCFLAAAIVPNIIIYLRYKNHPKYFSLGASGIVVWAILTLLIVQPAQRFHLPILPDSPALMYAAAYIVYLVYATYNKTDNISQESHLSGAVIGIVTAIVSYPEVISAYFSKFGH